MLVRYIVRVMETDLLHLFPPPASKARMVIDSFRALSESLPGGVKKKLRTPVVSVPRYEPQTAITELHSSTQCGLSIVLRFRRNGVPSSHSMCVGQLVCSSIQLCTWIILYVSILLHVLEFCIQVLRLSCNVLSQSKFIRSKTS
jgi:hypothetical protein